MMEYIDPNDKYDVGVFNRNFKRIEDSINGGRPLDWLELPDIFQEDKFKIVILLDIKENAKNIYSFILRQNTGQSVSICVDWGDGTPLPEPDENGIIETPHVAYQSTNYLWKHEYDYSTIDAPLTQDGNKQVIVTITANDNGENNGFSDYVLAPTTNNIDGIRANATIGLIRECSINAVGRNKCTLSIPFCINLRSLKMKNVGGISAADSFSIEELSIFDTVMDGPFAISMSSRLKKLQIPPGKYSSVIIGTHGIEEIIAQDLSECSANPNLGSSYALKKCLLSGLNRGFTLTQAIMTRDAIIEMLQSLGQANMSLPATNRTISLTTLPAYSELTDADKQIAIDKGFVVP